jgi:hypothetical protein
VAVAGNASDLGDALHQHRAGIDVVGQLDAEALGLFEPRIERQIGLHGGLLELLDRLVGEVGGTHQVGHHLAQHILVGVQALEALVEDDAITNCKSHQNGDGALHEYPKGQTEHHRPSVFSSIASKAAMVTLGGLSGRETRTDT